MVPVTEARERLREILEQLKERNFILVRHSRPAGILLSPERYEALIDRIESLEEQCSVLHAQLHADQGVPWEKAKEALGLKSETVAT